MEVIYTGPRQTPEMIVHSAQQEDMDLIGLSILSGAHIEFACRVIDLLKERRMEDIPVIMGGIVPKEDIPLLKQMGVKATFGPGSNTRDVVEFIQKEMT